MPLLQSALLRLVIPHGLTRCYPSRREAADAFDPVSEMVLIDTLALPSVPDSTLAAEIST